MPGMAAEINLRIFGRQIPHVGIFADQVIDAACFAAPFLVLPRAADGGNIGQPGNFTGHFFEFVGISQLPGTAGALENEKLVRAGNFFFLPIVVERPDITDKRRDARDRADQQMVRAFTGKVEGEIPFGGFSQA